MSSLAEDRASNRVANVKTMAARIAAFGEGYSVREFMDALALASGSMITAAYRGPGREVALSRFLDELQRAVTK